jgi:DNA-directed RNA polymerase specialized sigma subunit
MQNKKVDMPNLVKTVNNDCINKLVEDHIYLANKIAMSIYKRVMSKGAYYGVDVDDLKGVAYLGLIKTALKFDETRGIPFSHYASICVKGYVLDSIRDKYRINRIAREVKVKTKFSLKDKKRIEKTRAPGRLSTPIDSKTNCLCCGHSKGIHDRDIACFGLDGLCRCDGFMVRQPMKIKFEER